MKLLLAASLAVLALAGCSSNKSDARTEAQRHLSLAPVEVTLTHSNVTEFDGQIAILVKMELVDGNTVVTIPAITSWPITNGFLGLDHFYYGASSSNHPIIRVKDEGCDEPVVGGQACGWAVNFDGIIADGFGSFASKKSNGPASHGATTQDLVFVLQGDVNFAANDHGAMFAVHGRFEQDCSAWFSDGTATCVEPEPACIPVPEYTCSITVDPAALEILAGGWASTNVTVTETGAPVVPITLSVVAPVPLPPGVSVGLVPNPVTPPGNSLLTVQTAPDAWTGTTQLVILGEGQAGGQTFRCRATLDLEILPPPPPPMGGCYCAP